MMCALLRLSMSGVKSPVSYTTLFFSLANLGTQSISRSLAKDFRGAMYTQLLSGLVENILRMASSLIMVFPEPVGAPISTFLSVWYKLKKSCVWMGLKKLNLE